jgi:hypothetical protein
VSKGAKTRVKDRAAFKAGYEKIFGKNHKPSGVARPRYRRNRSSPITRFLDKEPI